MVPAASAAAEVAAPGWVDFDLVAVEVDEEADAEEEASVPPESKDSRLARASLELPESTCFETLGSAAADEPPSSLVKKKEGERWSASDRGRAEVRLKKKRSWTSSTH